RRHWGKRVCCQCYPWLARSLLNGRYTVCVGGERLVYRTERWISNSHQWRDRFSVHLWRTSRLGAQLRQASETGLRRLGRWSSRRSKLRVGRQEPPDRLPCEWRRNGLRKGR